MNNLWKIFAHEYRRHVLRRRFLMALLSIPLWVVLMAVIAVFSVLIEINNTPVGYVDPAQFIQHNVLPNSLTNGTGTLPFQRFADEAQARAALDGKKIQAYYVLPADYRQTRTVHLVYREQPKARVENRFYTLLRYNSITSLPDPVIIRVLAGPNMVFQSTTEQDQQQNPALFKILLPLAMGFFLIASVFTSSGYLMQSVVEEKENRTIEILATSASAQAIMGGKIIALVMVGLTQIFVWSFFPLLALIVARSRIPFLSTIHLDWAQILLMALTALPTFVLISAIMASIGATITEAREGQQIAGLVSLLAVLPYMLAMAIIANPNGVVALVLSFFPLTASLTVLLRMAFGDVPLWQTLLSIAIVLAASVGSLWLAGRLFREGMLRYGKPMPWKDVLQAIGLARPKNKSGPAAYTKAE